MLGLCLTYLDQEEDKTRFEEIYYSYRKQMFSLALSLLHRREDAEDVVSAVFLRIARHHWSTIQSFSQEKDVRNYLLKSVKHAALDLLNVRKRSISLDRIVELRQDKQADWSDGSFLDEICNRMEYEQIVEAIRSLDGKYRDALYYRHVLELSVAETAKSLGQTVAATKKQLVRGKKMLLERLGAL